MAPVTLEIEYVKHLIERAFRLRRYVPDHKSLRMEWHLHPETWTALRRHLTAMETGEGATATEGRRLYGVPVVCTAWMSTWDIQLVITDAPA